MHPFPLSDSFNGRPCCFIVEDLFFNRRTIPEIVERGIL